MQRLGINLETIAREVKKHVGSGPEEVKLAHIPYTPRVKRVLALAAEERKALNHTYLGTEHILLGLLREGDGVAARVLRSLDVNLEETRKEILKELDPDFGK
jgi:ATP-dependent Clp protease ATP-binding subunit ClpC